MWDDVLENSVFQDRILRAGEKLHDCTKSDSAGTLVTVHVVGRLIHTDFNCYISHKNDVLSTAGL